MKTIPVSLFVAGLLAPAVTLAQTGGGTQGPLPREGHRKLGGQHEFLKAWKAADKDGDGSLSMLEFDGMPRVQGLPEEKRSGLFKRLDKNSDGKLDREELGRIARPHDGQGPVMPRLWELDVDKSGGVSLDEFRRGRIFGKLSPEKQEAVFRRLDTNGDGVISPKDKPKSPSKHDGGKIHPKRPDGGKPEGFRMEGRQMIRQLDQNADGALSFEEFRAGPAVRDLTEDEQEDRFEMLDKNHDLKITAEDFPPPALRGDEARPKKAPPAAPTE